MNPPYSAIGMWRTLRYAAAALILAAGPLGSHTAHADGSGNVDSVTGAVCMQDVYDSFGQGGGLGCTANDVQLATATNITINDDGCAFPGDTVSFTADFDVVVTANARHDVGIYFSLDGDPNGDGALTGQCTVSTPAYAPSPPWVDLDGTADNTVNSNDFGYCSPDGGTTIASPNTPCDGGSPAAGDAQCVAALGAGHTCEEFGDGVGVTGDPIQDTCGDITSASNPLQPTVSLTVTCVDDDGDGKLDLPYCSSWRQPGGNELCLTPLAAYPGTTSKCNCDPGFAIDIDVPGQITGVDKVTLDANGNPLPGDPTVFDFSLTGPDSDLPDNFTLTDAQDPHATPGLDAGIYTLLEAAEVGWNLVSAVCTSDQGNPDQDLIASGGNVTVASGESLTCTFTNQQDVVPPNIVVTKTADPDNVDEPGGSVTFSILVENNSTSPVTLNSLVDDIHGDLFGQGTCSVPQSLAASDGTVGSGPDTYSCSFTANVNGNAGDSETDTVTATASNAAGSDTAEDSATVTITDTPSAIEIIKLATPDTVDEPGGPVTFSFTVNNLSTVDSVDINSLNDTIHGDLNGQGDCSVPQTIAAGGSYSCSFTANVNGNAGDVETNVVTASGLDDDGNPVSDDDTETVTITDTPSAIEIIKLATPDTVDEPGGPVTFSFTVNNLSTVDSVDINSLNDTIHGDLNGQGDCSVPQTIAAGGSYSCSFTANVNGNAGDVETNVVTASGLDDDGNPVSDDDTETVTITDTPSAIEIIKLATPDTVDEPGGPVTFSFTVNNLSTVDSVDINSLNDTIHGDLNGQGDCSVPQTIAAGGSYSCSFTANVNGNAGDVETNVVTASGLDDDGNPVSDDDTETVTITDTPSAIEIIKLATPDTVDEPGGPVTFSFTVNNLSTVDSVDINSLNDTIHGDLNGQGDCSVPQTIAAGGSYSCSFTANVNGNAGDVETNVVTASGLDDDGNPVSDDDTETVTITDTPSAIEIIKLATPDTVDEPGGPVTFSFTVNNLSTVDSVDINSLNDTIHGDLNGQGDCSVPQTIAAGGSYSCSFTANVNGNAGDVETNVVTASGLDDDGNPVSDDDTETVTITDTPSAIEIIKLATPDTVDEPGGPVTFSFTVNNLSTVDSVDINSLNDTIHGDLNGQGDCSVPQTIAAGGSYSCSFTANVNGNAGDVETNVVTASGLDDDGNPVSDDDTETVTFEDVPPVINMTKTANPTSVPETGGDVTFTFEVTNDGTEDVTLTSLTDSVFGDLNGQGDCATGGLIPIGGSYSCSLTVNLSADDLADHVNVASSVGTDDDGTTDDATDDETVTFEDVPPVINMTKTANPTSVPETGGDVTFTFEVTNDGTEDVTLTSLTDSVFGDLNGQGDCATGGLIPIGGSYSCSLTVNLSADDLADHVNVASSVGTDDDGTTDDATDDETVTFEDVPPVINMTKTANPTSVPETGGDVTFTFEVTNDGTEDVTLTSLTDSVFGDLNGQGDCATGGLIPIGGSYSCSLTVNLSADDLADHVNVASSVGTDDDGTTDDATDDETVTFEDVPPVINMTKTANPTSVPETGGDVTFTFEVTNDGTEDVTLTSLTDSVFGDLNGQGDCATGGLIPIGGSYSCSLTVNLSADDLADHVNVASSVGTDDDGTTDDATDDETVTFEDVPPVINMTKTANPTSVPETGGDVTFTFEVTNDGTEDVTLTSLTDSVFGDLNGQGDCATGGLIPIGGSYSCSLTVNLSADDLADHVNVASSVGTDDDGTTDDATDDETVTFEDVPPVINMTKTANPTSVPETGGDVTFTFEVTNDGTEDVTLTSLTDSVFGDLNGQGDCATGGLIPIGGSYSCSLTVNLSADDLADHVNVASSVGTDDDGTTDDATDDETVTFEDVPPVINMTKTANPTSVPETGGDVTFTFEVTNDGTEDVTLTSLTDSVFGDLNGQGDCATGGLIPIGGSYSCSLTVNLSADDLADHVNVASSVGTDDDGTTDDATDDETVTFEDVPPVINMTKTANPTSVPETGGDVTFTFEVTNDGTEDVTLTSLTDSVFGDLNGQGDCATGGLIPIGGSYSCSLTVNLSADDLADHVNVASSVGTDDDGTTDDATDDETVTFEDLLPDVTITKTADPTSVPEPGGDVEFTIIVTNNSLEDATIDSLVDTDFDLAANCADAVGRVLPSGASYTCVFTEFIAGNVGEDHQNTATVVASDNDGNTDTESDNADVTITNADPAISVEKTADQLQVFAPGEDVTFTVVINNASLATDPVTINSLTDSIHGNLNGQGTCAVPQTIEPDESYTCSFTVLVDGDETDVVTASGIDDEGTPVSGSDDATVDMINPSVAIEKSTNGYDADSATGPEILAGSAVNWNYIVTNNGDVALVNVSVADNQGVALTCPKDTLAVNELMTCTASGISVADQYANLGTATATHTDVDGNTADRTDEDPSHYYGAAPSVDIVKTFVDDSIIAGGTGSSFELVVTNDGNVDLDDVSVFDDVDDRLTVTGVSGTGGADNDSDSDAQTVEWLIASLGVGESVTITVNFTVNSSVPEVLGLPNMATASDTYTDDSGNSTDIGDEDTDTIDILVDITLTIVKTFDPNNVPQGTLQSFTIEVSNSGPSDALIVNGTGVNVTDTVHGSLKVTGVSVTSGNGDCSASAGQEVDCTVDIPAGESVLITVDYIAAPFLDDSGATTGGDEFRIVFANGSVLEGSTFGSIYLDGEDVTADVDVLTSVTRNDIIFDPPGSDAAFEIHLSCSDPFTGGWGQSGGPTEGVDVNWQIAFFSIARYNNNGFIKNCGNVVNSFDVPNTATASGTDSFPDDDTVSDDATVTVGPGITLDRLQTKGKRVTARLTNLTGEDKVIQDVMIAWPTNGDLKKVWLTYDRISDVIWQGSDGPPDALLDSTFVGWNGGTLFIGEAILRFDFTDKVENIGYVIRVNFEDGTWLDINV